MTEKLPLLCCQRKGFRGLECGLPLQMLGWPGSGACGTLKVFVAVSFHQSPEEPGVLAGVKPAEKETACLIPADRLPTRGLCRLPGTESAGSFPLLQVPKRGLSSFGKRLLFSETGSKMKCCQVFIDVGFWCDIWRESLALYKQC